MGYHVLYLVGICESSQEYHRGGAERISGRTGWTINYSIQRLPPRSSGHTVNLEHRQGLWPPGDSGHDVLTTGGCVLQGIPYISLAVYASSPPRTLPLVGARRSSQGDRQGGLAPSNSSTSQRRPAPEPPLHDRNASSLPPGAMNGRSVGSPDWRWWPRTSRATPCEGSLRFDGRVASMVNI